MTAKIPEGYLDLLTGPVVIGLVTLMEDGSPQVTPVWCLYEDGYVLINTARGRQKDENMESRAKVAILAIDPKNPYRWLEVRGEVEDITEEGAVDVIDRMSFLYRNRPYYAGPDGEAQRTRETRVTYKIRPTHVNAGG